MQQRHHPPAAFSMFRFAAVPDDRLAFRPEQQSVRHPIPIRLLYSAERRSAMPDLHEIPADDAPDILSLPFWKDTWHRPVQYLRRQSLQRFYLYRMLRHTLHSRKRLAMFRPAHLICGKMFRKHRESYGFAVVLPLYRKQ